MMMTSYENLSMHIISPLSGNETNSESFVMSTEICTEHGSLTIMFCTKCQKDWSTKEVDMNSDSFC